MTTRVALAIAALVVATPSWGTPKAEINALAAAQHEHEGAATQQAQPGMQSMMKMHEQMMAEMKANRARLDTLVQQMNSASGNAKVDAIAAVVTELVRQQNTMHDRMGQMHEQMMSGHGMMGGPNMMGR
jgi:predicted  nucleic acid-binding Zn-ribbon protein